MDNEYRDVIPEYKNDETKNLVDLEFVICVRVAIMINAESQFLYAHFKKSVCFDGHFWTQHS